MASSKSTVLVTGATGYLASHIVYQLLDEGYKVKGSVRDVDSSKSAFLKTFHTKSAQLLELVNADALETECWNNAVKGCDYVIHTASPFVMSLPEDELVKVAVSGTKNVLNAVASHKESIRKVVLTSSVASIVTGHPPSRIPAGPFTEDDWSVPETTHGYELSKLKAEQAAWELQKEHQFKMDAICPGLILGPVFAKHHLDCQSSDYIVTLLKNTLLFGVDVSLPVTDVRDVAALHILSMEKDDTSGNRYISASDDHCSSSIMRIASALKEGLKGKCKYNPPSNKLPNCMAFALSFVHPDLKPAREWIGTVCEVSNKKAKEELKMKFRLMEPGIVEHAISLFKYANLDPKGFPQDEIDNFEAY